MHADRGSAAVVLQHCVHACVCACMHVHCAHVCICMERGKVRKGEERYGRGGGRRGEGGEEGRGGEEEWEQFLMNSITVL